MEGAAARTIRPGGVKLRSGKDVRELFVAADACPAECVAAVEVVENEWVGAELEQGDDGFALT